MTKYQQSRPPSAAALQLQRLAQQEAQIARLKKSLELAEGQVEMLKGQREELARLLHIYRPRAYDLMLLLQRVIEVSIVGPELRAEIEKFLQFNEEPKVSD